jgi:hypothetical protein
VAVSLTFLVYGFGHVGEAAQSSLAGSPLPFIPYLFAFVRMFLPNFQMFDVSAGIVAQEYYSLLSMSLFMAYAGTFILLYLLLAQWVFASRDL